MRTPAGTECPFYYADFHRGRNKQACRLIERNAASLPWEPRLCTGCPVPRLTQANACQHLVLEATVAKAWLGLQRKIKVTAHCTKSLTDVPQPEIGCGQCHGNLDKFITG